MPVVLDLLGHRAGQVHLVEDGDDFEVVLQGEVEVGDGLRLDALRGVHDEQRALAGGNGPRHLVGKIHVAGRVDEVQDVRLPLVGVLHLYGVGLDGDAPFALQVHVVQQLRLRLPMCDGVGMLQQPVRQRALAVVDMRDDAKIAYVLHVWSPPEKRTVQR